MTRIPPVVCGIILLALSTCASASRPEPAKPTVQANQPARYGKLQVVGTHLCDSNGKPVQLRGMSWDLRSRQDALSPPIAMLTMGAPQLLSQFSEAAG